MRMNVSLPVFIKQKSSSRNSTLLFLVSVNWDGMVVSSNQAVKPVMPYESDALFRRITTKNVDNSQNISSVNVNGRFQSQNV
jgi:hypothetical protein